MPPYRDRSGSAARPQRRSRCRRGSAPPRRRKPRPTICCALPIRPRMKAIASEHGESIRAARAGACSAARWCIGCCNRCPISPRERRRDAARRYLARNAAGLDRSRARGAGRERAGADRRSSASPTVFAPGSRAEVSIVGRLERPARPPALVSGQIDRLVVTPDEVLIVDFKTNHAPPSRRPRRPQPMSASSRFTARCWRKLYPDRPVRAALLWTETPELMEISAPALDAAAGILSCRRDASLTRQDRVHRLAP